MPQPHLSRWWFHFNSNEVACKRYSKTFTLGSNQAKSGSFIADSIIIPFMPRLLPCLKDLDGLLFVT